MVEELNRMEADNKKNELSSLSDEELVAKKQNAVEDEDYDLAKQIKDEQDRRKSWLLQQEIGRTREEQRLGADERIQDLLKVGEYENCIKQFKEDMKSFREYRQKDRSEYSTDGEYLEKQKQALHDFRSEFKNWEYYNEDKFIKPTINVDGKKYDDYGFKKVYRDLTAVERAVFTHKLTIEEWWNLMEKVIGESGVDYLWIDDDWMDGEWIRRINIELYHEDNSSSTKVNEWWRLY